MQIPKLSEMCFCNCGPNDRLHGLVLDAQKIWADEIAAIEAQGYVQTRRGYEPKDDNLDRVIYNARLRSYTAIEAIRKLQAEEKALCLLLDDWGNRISEEQAIAAICGGTSGL